MSADWKGKFLLFWKMTNITTRSSFINMNTFTYCFNNWSLEAEGCPNQLCHKSDEETDVTAAARADVEDLQPDFCSRYRPLCALPRPIMLHWARSWIKQQSPRKMRQQWRDFVSLLIEIKLNVKEGTHRTSVKIKLGEICTVPICVTKACSPLGK